MQYKHTQIGHLMIGVLLALIAYFSVLVYVSEYDLVVIISMLAVIAILSSFLSLTVQISQGILKIRFGYGIFSKTFNIQDISSARVAEHRWYYGWGIKYWWWPRTWIYSVSGMQSIEIILQNGKRYRIGTDEPEKVIEALRKEHVNIVVE